MVAVIELLEEVGFEASSLPAAERLQRLRRGCAGRTWKLSLSSRKKSASRRASGMVTSLMTAFCFCLPVRSSSSWWLCASKQHQQGYRWQLGFRV